MTTTPRTIRLCQDCEEDIDLSKREHRECECGQVVSHRACNKPKCACQREPDYGGGGQSETERRDLIDAGRGHLVKR
jgi:hypothetical protein